MVGVPGRSKGCRTCRRRKKGCDRNVPSCNQCIAAGLVCGGYGRDLVWVNATSEEPSQKRKPPNQAPWHVRYAGPSDPETEIVMRDSLARTARELKYLGLFWSAYLPNGRAFSPHATKLSTGGWTNVLGRLYDSEPTLRLAALSMSASVLGGQANDQHLKIKGMQTYSQAIEEMSLALKDPSRATGDGLLAASRLMEFYEILFGADADMYPEAHVAGWKGHNDGQRALILARGPKGLQSGAGHQLFADGRLNVVVGDLAKRKASPLCTPEWKSQPWQVKPKSSKDRLMDIFVEIPGLLEKLDTIRSCPDAPDAAQMRVQLLMECRQNHEALMEWEKELGDDLLLYDYTVVGLPLPDAKADMDVALLQSIHLYWCVALLLYSTMGFLIKMGAASAPAAASTTSTTSAPASTSTSTATSPCPSDTSSPKSQDSSYGSSDSSVSSPPSEQGASRQMPTDHLGAARKNPRLYACKIAYSVHLFWEPSTGAFGNHIGLFPLGLAMRFLAASGPIETCQEYMVMRKLFVRPFLGTFVGRFLSNLQRDVPQHKLRNMEGYEGIQARASKWWAEGEQIPIRSKNV